MDEKTVDINALAEEILADLKELKGEVAEVKSAKEAVTLIPEVVKKVEEVAGNVKLASTQKKELAVAVLNKLIDIPWIPENVEAVAIGYAIDAVIAAVNKWFGSAWLAKLGA